MNKLNKFTCAADILDIDQALKECMEIKKNVHATPKLGKNKSVGLVFLNPSLRTRMSMQRACQNLGFHAMIINAGQGSWAWELEKGAVMDGGSVEHIKEAAQVMSQYCDILALRCFPTLKDKRMDVEDRVLKQFMEYASVPVISMESATRHPLQSFSDLLTIKENWCQPRKPKVVLSWAPHVKPIAHSVANSFCEWIRRLDAEVCITHPKGYELNPDFTQDLPIYYNQTEALRDADFVYVKNWSSFQNYGSTPKVKEDWMLTLEKLKITQKAKVMHCLPVRRNVVISDDVMDSNHSLIYQQAGNRMITAQWVLKNIIS